MIVHPYRLAVGVHTTGKVLSPLKALCGGHVIKASKVLITHDANGWSHEVRRFTLWEIHEADLPVFRFAQLFQDAM